jgi:hypothetical protein
MTCCVTVEVFLAHLHIGANSITLILMFIKTGWVVQWLVGSKAEIKGHILTLW